VVRRHSPGALLIGLVPFAALCFSVSAWDRVHPMILGLPFNVFWVLSWTVLTPVCLRCAYILETARLGERAARPPQDRGTS
jgi:hypothetical protein